MNNLKKDIKKYLEERDWDNLNPVNISKSVVIESAELLEIFQWENGTKSKKITKEQIEKVKEELADVLIYCIHMGIALDLDLIKIVKSKLAKSAEKYPAHLFKKSNVNKASTNKLYEEIKASYRAKRKK